MEKIHFYMNFFPFSSRNMIFFLDQTLYRYWPDGYMLELSPLPPFPLMYLIFQRFHFWMDCDTHISIGTYLHKYVNLHRCMCESSKNLIINFFFNQLINDVYYNLYQLIICMYIHKNVVSNWQVCWHEQ